jgi:N-acetylmuramoyl-L-alanine amidase
VRSSKADLRLPLFLTLFSLLPFAAAESQQWTVRGAGAATTVQESAWEGYAVLPASILTSLGGEMTVRGGEVGVTIAGARITFRPGSPFYLVGDEVRQLVYPVYELRGAVFLPIQFFVDHLPALSGGAVAVNTADRTLHIARGAAAQPRTAASAVAQPRAESPPAQPQPRPDAPVNRAPPAAAAAAAPPRPANASPPASPTAAKRRLVVIDAGHGGVDPGAKGPAGTLEKDITLAVSRRLAALLREDANFEVRMTRDRDTLIALTDRTRLANGWRGEGQDAVFISIHTNASTQRSAWGFETFFLSEARTEDARRVAEMENSAQRFESPGTQLDPMSFIFHDLRQNRYLRDSSDWAAMIQRRLATVHPGPNRGVKQAGFVVLNGAFMPAVLVELGFISNAREEQLLGNADHQRKLAAQLATAVKEFFDRSAAAAAR